MKVTAVVPAYNEGRTVGSVVRSLLPLVQEIVVVDDGSADRTAREARTAGARVVSHMLNRGLGAAIGTGVAAALDDDTDIIVTFDADGQHDAKDIERITAPIREGAADIVIGVRTLDRHLMPVSRRAANWIGNALTFVLFGKWVRDSQSGLRAFSRQAAEELEIKCDRMEVSSEIVREIRHHGWRLTEVPIRPVYTDYSMSKGQGFIVGLKTAGKLLLRRLMM
ncbi:MAG: glycosyltransferase family 2 protein [Patescibacteria group bacterium]|nr:glycosyltransferase family 2 protein [Patescibacteria group bacterium]